MKKAFFICLVITEHHHVVFSPPCRSDANSILRIISFTSLAQAALIANCTQGTCHGAEEAEAAALISSPLLQGHPDVRSLSPVICQVPSQL